MNERRIEIFLGLGSNVDAEHNLALACAALRERYGDIRCSAAYRNAAVGFDGDPFLNLVVQAHCDESPPAVVDALEAIHALAGRERGSERFGPRELDIDLLLYGDVISRRWKLPRKDLVKYGFVALPMAQLAPELRHPLTGQSMQEIWQALQADAPAMQPVTLAL